MLSTLKLPVTIAVLVSNVFATPTLQSAGLTMNLRRRAHSGNTEDWAKSLREGLISKYGGKAASVRRSTGSNLQVASISLLNDYLNFPSE
jgi:hypothetical protein